MAPLNLSQFLTLAAIAEWTGRKIAELRRLAKRFAWRSLNLSTGKRGRPPVVYHVIDVAASLGIVGS